MKTAERKTEKTYQVTLVCVEDMETLRHDCYQDLISVSQSFDVLFYQYEDLPEHNQIDMNFAFSNSELAFMFMEESIEVRPDAALSTVTIIEGMNTLK